MFKNLTKKRLTVLLVSLSLILVVGVGVTLAYVFASTGDVVNTFTPSHVSCAVVEMNNNSQTQTQVSAGNVDDILIKQNVQIKNTGDTEAYIRVAVVVNWKNANGHVWATAPDLNKGDYTIVYNTSSKWAKLAADNYWYYEAPVSPNEGSNLTDVLIESATQINPGPIGTDGSQYYLSIEIVASAIQSNLGTTAQDAFAKAAQGITQGGTQ